MFQFVTQQLPVQICVCPTNLNRFQYKLLLLPTFHPATSVGRKRRRLRSAGGMQTAPFMQKFFLTLLRGRGRTPLAIWFFFASSSSSLAGYLPEF